MMTRRLAGYFSMMACATFMAGWLWRQSAGKPTMPPDEAMGLAILIAVVYFILGVFIARLGVNLVQEMLAERRGREEEKLLQARELYERTIAGGEASPETEASSPPAPEKAKAGA